MHTHSTFLHRECRIGRDGSACWSHRTRSGASALPFPPTHALAPWPQLRKPILLEGSPGVGKTSLIAAMAKAVGEAAARRRGGTAWGHAWAGSRQLALAAAPSVGGIPHVSCPTQCCPNQALFSQTHRLQAPSWCAST